MEKGKKREGRNPTTGGKTALCIENILKWSGTDYQQSKGKTPQGGKNPGRKKKPSLLLGKHLSKSLGIKGVRILEGSEKAKHGRVG